MYGKMFCFLLLGLAVGLMISQFIQYKNTQCYGKYSFINAQEICGKSPVISKVGYIATQNKIEAFIAGEKATGHLTDAAVYFRDLENGPIFGIEEDVEFAPASLLKLPLALVYLTQAERNPEILQEQASVANPQWSFTQTFPSAEEINPNAPHTIENLLMRMIAYSDNNAYGVLQTHLYDIGQQALIPKTFLELGFIDPKSINDEVLSVRRYASIFRALYNMSYLNVDLSERLLSWLSQSDFTQGLRGGVPESIVISHKFGERFTEDGKKQLHDCGIVYYPDNPYLLCVMTRGTNFEDLSTVIQHISGEVYQEVDSRRIR